MKTDWRNTPAYHGRGWQIRDARLRDEITKSGIWNSSRVNSEWAKLECVALYTPSLELRAIKNPRRVQHLRPVVLSRLRREFKELAQVYRRLGVRVIELDPNHLPKDIGAVPPPNLMFVRDLFVNTPEGCVVGRMASRVRAGEEKFAAATLAANGIILRATVAGRGLFEGADALWLNPHTVLCGVGNRTNKEGYEQLKSVLALQDVECLPVTLPKDVQHLLGILQLPGPRTAVVRVEKAPSKLLRWLKRERFDVIPVHESEEVEMRQGMNFVTVNEHKIVMASNCPELRGWLESAGLEVAAEVDISQLCNAAGGLACATGIVGRRIV